MSKIEIEKERVQAAYKDACDGVKEMLATLFGKDVCETAKPTLDDYKSIKSYEDACVALNIKPIDEDALLQAGCKSRHIALMKLEVICRALWGKKFTPMPDAEGNKVYWYPWFALYTKGEISQMSDEKRKSMLGALFGGLANYGAGAGFGALNAHNRSSYSSACIGFRLCQETEEKARYFGQQFIELWAEYLAYGFKVTEHLK